MGFRENLKEELAYSGILVKELSTQSGVNKRTIDSYLMDGGSVPSVEAAVKIAAALRVSVEYLVTGRQNGNDVVVVTTDANTATATYFRGTLPGSVTVQLPAGSYAFRYKVSGDDGWKESPNATVSVGNITTLNITKESGIITYRIE
ncbi:hypothetical protein AGMMS49579_23660 [Spirochaetia bacterium]|nr:hypothetical protein AGMMS49579_23660 [Spirochaetia bacterium]